jgi:hypothetical protein
MPQNALSMLQTLCSPSRHFQGTSEILSRHTLPLQVFSAKAHAATTHTHKDSEISPEDPAILNIKPSGAWLTKVDALVRRVLWLERSAPEEKCLIFSQFPEALSFVRNALTINKVKCASIIGNNKKVRMPLLWPQVVCVACRFFSGRCFGLLYFQQLR